MLGPLTIAVVCDLTESAVVGEMTYTVSSGALTSTQTKPEL